MSDSDARSDWLFQVTKPGFLELKRVCELLLELPTMRWRPRREFRGRPLRLRATLSEIIDNLGDRLQNDYAEHVAEQHLAPYGFDYVVMQDGSSALAVYTRLFDKQSRGMGSIFYGPTVGRVASETFCLWAEKDSSE
jgi:hypothetical protein